MVTTSRLEGEKANAMASSPSVGDAADQTRREWARRYLSRCAGPLVEYGSVEWAALPDTAPEKVASCVAAAEREVLARTLERMELEAELEWYAARHKAADDAAFRAAGRAHRQAWDGKTGTFRPDPQIAREVESDWLRWVGGDAA